jgi:iron complex outermembrane receptor protein
VGVEMLTGDGGAAYHAGVSRRARFPALRELYSGALDRFQPNPDLAPERVVTVEAGVTLHRGGADLQAVAFHNRVDDAVVRTTLPDRRFFRVNRDRLRTAGVELLARCPLGPASLSGNLVVQDAELTDTSTDEKREPESLPEAYGSLDAKVRLGGAFTLGAGADYTGSQFAIDVGTGEDTRLDAAVLFGAWIGREWSLPASWGGSTFSRVDARIAAENLTDEAQYEIPGIPGPGRRFRFELRLR